MIVDRHMNWKIGIDVDSVMKADVCWQRATVEKQIEGKQNTTVRELYEHQTLADSAKCWVISQFVPRELAFGWAADVFARGMIQVSIHTKPGVHEFLDILAHKINHPKEKVSPQLKGCTKVNEELLQLGLVESLSLRHAAHIMSLYADLNSITEVAWAIAYAMRSASKFEKDGWKWALDNLGLWLANERKGIDNGQNLGVYPV